MIVHCTPAFTFPFSPNHSKTTVNLILYMYTHTLSRTNRGENCNKNIKN